MKGSWNQIHSTRHVGKVRERFATKLARQVGDFSLHEDVSRTIRKIVLRCRKNIRSKSAKVRYFVCCSKNSRSYCSVRK